MVNFDTVVASLMTDRASAARAAVGAALGRGVSVRDYGAMGNGTTNDTAAIKAAIAASKAGDEILFNSGPLGTSIFLVDETIEMTQNRMYRAVGNAVFLKQANGADLAAVLACAGWVAGNTYSSGPVTVKGLSIDGNRDNNTALTHGIVLLNYRSLVEDCNVARCDGDGIAVEDRNAANVVISNTAVENRLVRNLVYDVTGHGIYVHDYSGSGKCTDGYLDSNVVYQTGATGIKNARAAGWFMHDNHVYAIGTHGYDLDNLWNTFFVNNEVDGFAVSNTGTCMGVNCNSILTGRPSVITGNTVAANEAPRPTATYVYYRLRAASSGTDVSVVFSDNVANCDSQGGTDPRWCSFQPNGSTLRVEMNGMVVRNFVSQDPTIGTPVASVKITSGTHPMVAAAGAPLGLKRVTDERPVGVMETIDRDAVGSSSSTPSAGTLALTYVTADKDEDVASILSYTKGTAAVGSTTSYVCVYSEAANGDLTLLGASDGTVMWTSVNTGYTGALVTPAPVTIGMRLAYGVLHVGSSTAPALLGYSSVAGLLQQTPRKNAALTGQTSPPATIANGDLLLTGAGVYYGRLSA